MSLKRPVVSQETCPEIGNKMLTEPNDTFKGTKNKKFHHQDTVPPGIKALEYYYDFVEKVRRSQDWHGQHVEPLIAETFKFHQLRAKHKDTSPSFVIDQICVFYFQMSGVLLQIAIMFL